MNCNTSLEWYGCYTGNYDFWVPDAMSHPAKMAPGLCHRIFQHLEDLGLLAPGATVLDPMGGIGTTALVAASRGYRAVTVELESNFIALQYQNKIKLETKLKHSIDWTILQGDSRKLSQLLQEAGYTAVTSPPYADQMSSSKGSIDFLKAGRPDKLLPGAHGQGVDPNSYGDSPGNIGNLPDVAVASPPYGDLANSKRNTGSNLKPGEAKTGRTEDGMRYSDDANNIGNLPDVAITSPPYAESQQGGGIAKNGYRGKYLQEMGKNQPDKVGERCGYQTSEQGNTDGQISSLPDVAITSPPYEDSDNDGARKNPEKYFDFPLGHSKTTSYGDAEGQIGKLKTITSPPYENAEVAGPWQGNLDDRQSRRQVKTWQGYGETPGQLSKESYLDAMRLVYAEIAKCSNVLVIVTKNPTRAGKLRHLDLDTISVLQATGWNILCRHRAILFTESETATLFGDSVKKDKGRIGFFKRLAKHKGSVIAQWEDVMVAVRRP